MFLINALLPDPTYLLVPIGTSIGSLVWGIRELLLEQDPDLPRALGLGYIYGGIIGFIIVVPVMVVDLVRILVSWMI